VPQDTLPQLKTLLNDPSPYLQSAIVTTLGITEKKTHQIPAIHALLEKYYDSNTSSELKADILRSLGGYIKPKGLDLMKNISEHTEKIIADLKKLDPIKEYRQALSTIEFLDRLNLFFPSKNARAAIQWFAKTHSETPLGHFAQLRLDQLKTRNLEKLNKGKISP
jgi:hypothetical protein